MDFAIILFWSGAILSLLSLSSLIVKFHGSRIVKAFLFLFNLRESP
jgi:hypothetical protein